MVRAMLRGRAAILAPNADWMVPVLEKHFGDLAETVRFHSVRMTDGLPLTSWKPSVAATGRWFPRYSGKARPLAGLGEGLFGHNRRLHLLGPMQEAIELPRWIGYHGKSDPNILAGEWFPKVAGIVTLSTHDEGRPQVMIEAMAAGLPVIASDLPAHLDLVQHRQTGWLAAIALNSVRAWRFLKIQCKTGLQGKQVQVDSGVDWHVA